MQDVWHICRHCSLTTMIRSPLRYPGGKNRAVKLIGSLLPAYDEYREPFLGGGSVFVHAIQRFPKKKYWVNDLYPELFKFWEISQQDMGALIEQVYEWKSRFPDGKKLFLFLHHHLHLFNDIEKAAAFFIYNRITFSGTSHSGGYSQGAFDGRFNENSIQRLPAFARVIQGATITNLDYESLVQSTGNNVFIYLDPPYHAATKSALYGRNGHLHKGFDHQKFADDMKACPHQWLITYDDSEFIRDLFSFANIIPWDFTYGMRNTSTITNKTGKELFISNYLTHLPQL